MGISVSVQVFETYVPAAYSTRHHPTGCADILSHNRLYITSQTLHFWLTFGYSGAAGSGIFIPYIQHLTGKNMFKFWVRALLATLIAFSTLSLPTAASADTITFKMRSFHKNVVNVKYFSPSRKVNWPAGKVFVLKDSKTHDMKLTCVNGEQICYGAATSNKSAQWGVGIDGKGTCTSCCHRCNNQVTGIIDINQN
jgi:hypothetical protein